MPGNEVLRNAALGSQFGSSPKLRLIARQSDAGSMHEDDGAIRHSRSLRLADVHESENGPFGRVELFRNDRL